MSVIYIKKNATGDAARIPFGDIYGTDGSPIRDISSSAPGFAMYVTINNKETDEEAPSGMAASFQNSNAGADTPASYSVQIDSSYLTTPGDQIIVKIKGDNFDDARSYVAQVVDFDVSNNTPASGSFDLSMFSTNARGYSAKVAIVSDSTSDTDRLSVSFYKFDQSVQVDDPTNTKPKITLYEANGSATKIYPSGAATSADLKRVGTLKSWYEELSAAVNREDGKAYVLAVQARIDGVTNTWEFPLTGKNK